MPTGFRLPVAEPKTHQEPIETYTRKQINIPWILKRDALEKETQNIVIVTIDVKFQGCIDNPLIFVDRVRPNLEFDQRHGTNRTKAFFRLQLVSWVVRSGPHSSTSSGDFMHSWHFLCIFGGPLGQICKSVLRRELRARAHTDPQFFGFCGSFIIEKPVSWKKRPQAGDPN